MAAPIVKCPTCGRELEWTPAALFRPFCSDRCRLIDLGAWISEKHSIPGEDTLPDDDGEEPQDKD
jgi:endogenous inhibitor of DNA gyrase (YacG/DUF329 family)